MHGPSTTRAPINTAPIPGLTNPLEEMLKNFMSSGQNPFANQNQPSLLQQQTGASYANALAGGPTAQQNALANSQGMLMGQINGPAGQDVLDAASPIFQRNLQTTTDTLRQSGPRFNSNTERLVGEQGNKALQDYNLFAQNVMESGRNRQLTAATTLGNLSQGADNSLTQLLSGAGNFANTMQGQQINANTAATQSLLDILGKAGQGPAALVNHPGGFANVMKALGTVGSVVGTVGGLFVNHGNNSDPYADEGALTGNPGNQAPTGAGYGPGTSVGGGSGSVTPDSVAPAANGYYQYPSVAPNQQMSFGVAPAPQPGYQPMAGNFSPINASAGGGGGAGQFSGITPEMLRAFMAKTSMRAF